jgi:hypothetical protein
MSAEPIKEWVRVGRAANGKSNLSVTLQDGNITVKWNVLNHGKVKDRLAEARKYAKANLTEIREALAELGDA